MIKCEDIRCLQKEHMRVVVSTYRHVWNAIYENYSLSLFWHILSQANAWSHPKFHTTHTAMFPSAGMLMLSDRKNADTSNSSQWQCTYIYTWTLNMTAVTYTECVHMTLNRVVWYDVLHITKEWIATHTNLNCMVLYSSASLKKFLAEAEKCE